MTDVINFKAKLVYISHGHVSKCSKENAKINFNNAQLSHFSLGMEKLYFRTSNTF